ncbi:MAG: Lin1244/Lin1753 domain-containing protein [Pedobacter sp.]|jgi:hypothetical protein
MAKDTYYFSHDYNARNDPKIRKLISKHGMIGYGIFWAIVEDLYQNANALPTDYDLIAFDMRADCEVVKSIVNDFELFVIDGSEFGSSAVERRLIERNGKSEKARQSAFKKWDKVKNDANALRTHCEPNAIKERKGKENKVIEGIIIPSWKDDFNVYLEECKKAYREYYNDEQFIKTQSQLNPNVNIKLSIAKGYENFWGKESGWKHKKKSRTKDIDWRQTIVNSIDMNKVYYTKQELEYQLGVQKQKMTY